MKYKAILYGCQLSPPRYNYKMRQIYFLDIDDCLIETSRLGKTELTAFETSLVNQSIPKAKEITKAFAASFHRLYDNHQGKKIDKKASHKLALYMDKI